LSIVRFYWSSSEQSRLFFFGAQRGPAGHFEQIFHGIVPPVALCIGGPQPPELPEKRAKKYRLREKNSPRKGGGPEKKAQRNQRYGRARPQRP